MIDREHVLPIMRQAQLLGMSRGAVHYLPRPTSAADLALMRRIDELHLEHPFMGTRMLRRQLRREGVCVGRRHVATLMQKWPRKSVQHDKWRLRAMSRSVQGPAEGVFDGQEVSAPHPAHPRPGV